MIWTQAQIKLHEKAAEKLDLIITKTFSLIKDSKNISEFEVQKFILDQFKKENLVSDKDKPIVAFGPNTSFVHYYPKEESALKLTKNMPILIDIWARVNEKSAPFADITWIGYKGQEVSQKYISIFNAVKLSRDEAILFIKKQLSNNEFPTGQDIDQIVRKTFDKFNWQTHFTHGTGHSLGTQSAHGRTGGHIRRSGMKLRANMGYTIEPGLYFDQEFGARLEMDFYIDSKMKFVTTTKIQKEIIKII